MLNKSNTLKYEQENINKLNEVLKDIELSKDEERVMLWLCGWERTSIEHICSVMNKLKEYNNV